MESLSHSQITTLLLALGLLLASARLLGELAKRFNQPAVIGEILAGILLGPTVLGHLWPEANQFLFPAEGMVAIVLSSFATLAVVLFLLVAGMEVDLSVLFRLKRQAVIIGACGLLAPFAMGFGLGQTVPAFVGMEPGADRLVFSLFLGVALAISALPVIAKTLMDLNLFRSDLGMLIVAIAIFHDIIGWVIFAIILGMMNPQGGVGGGSIGMTIGLTLLFTGVMLTVGRWSIHRVLPWLQAHTSWPGGVLGFALSLGLLGAAFTEWIGIHAIFGAFIVGVALGDSPHLRQQTRRIIEHFIAFIFAPLFFASIGLRVDFIAHFDWLLVLTVIVIACVGETLGCYVGARWAGFPKRQSWAIGFALNARGAMEIVLALLALQYGVIGERLFVALVVMALFTSIIAGPLMQWVLRRKQPARFRRYVSARTFRSEMPQVERREVVDALAKLAEPVAHIDRAALADHVWKREQLMSTGLPGGMAMPHARVPGLDQPVICIGVLSNGVDWDTPDGERVRLVLMVLTPVDADDLQLEVLADIGATFRDPEVVARFVRCENYTQFLAMLNTEQHDAEHGGPASPQPV